MTTFFQFALLGLGPAAVYLLLAAGILLIYKGSGVLNFAQGAMGMVGGYVYYELAQKHGVSGLPAIVCGGLASAVIGLLTYRLVMRRLVDGSGLIKLVATLALLIAIDAAGTLIWGVVQVQPESALPTSLFHIGGVTGTIDKPILLGIAAAITLLLWAGFRFTTMGLATRGLAESRRSVEALGWSQDTLAMINWGLAGFIGGVAGALIAPISGLQVTTMSLLVIPALAVALLAGFTSFPLALAGAIGLGVAQSEASNYIHVQGLPDALPVLVIVAFLVIRGKSLPVRGENRDRLPAIGTGRIRWALVIPATAAGLALMLGVFSAPLLGATVTSLEYIVVMLSIVVLTGYAGQLSLATVTFAGVGALVAGSLVASDGWPFLAAAVVALIAMIPAGIIFGLPALRTRGTTLAVVTLGLSVAVADTIFNNPDISGASGTIVGKPKLFGLDVDFSLHPARWTIVVVVCLLVCCVAVANMRRGRAGRRLLALRDNERAAAAVGINVVEGKLFAFVVAGVIAALGGILIGFHNQVIVFSSPSPFDSFQNVLLVVFVILGGVGFLLGPFYGGLLFITGGTAAYALSVAFSSDVDQYVALVGAVGLLFMITVHPDGMYTLHAKAAERLARRTSRMLGRAGKPSDVMSAQIGSNQSSRVRPALLEVMNLTVRFGGVVAVNDVSLQIAPGEIVGLIGPNGAGKTTVIDALSGFVKPSEGAILLDGTPIGNLAPHKRARMGISRSFQSLELFEDMTVYDNLRAASDSRDPLAYGTNFLRATDEPLSDVGVQAIREFRLEDDLLRRPSELPYGRRRLVAVARSVAVEPSVLLLDEPAAGLDSEEAAELAECVRAIARGWGIGILVVEHLMPFVMGLCDRVVVLDFGRKIADGSPTDVQADPAVVTAYLGEPERHEAEPAASGVTS